MRVSCCWGPTARSPGKKLRGSAAGLWHSCLTLRAQPQVGPFANPNEVYAFYNLPYCAPSEIEIKREDLGPLLKGDRPTKTLYDIRYRGAWASAAAEERRDASCCHSCRAAATATAAAAARARAHRLLAR